MTGGNLRTLAARAEIKDVIHLCCHILDRHRWDLMADVFHDDATVRYSYRANVQSYQEWVANARMIMSEFPHTLHQVGNMLIDINGDIAWSETYVTATHLVPPSAPVDSFWSGRNEPYVGIGGGRYVDRFEYRNAAWKIAARETFIEYRHDQPVHDGDLARVPAEFRGHWGDADVSRPVVARRLERVRTQQSEEEGNKA